MHMVRKLVLLSWLATLLSPASSALPSLESGPFNVQAVERKIGAGGFPNTSSNPFKKIKVTRYRVSYKGKPFTPLHKSKDPDGSWWQAYLLADAPQPAVLAMELNTLLLTEQDGELKIDELQSRDASQNQWQWLDSEQGQPGPLHQVAISQREQAGLSLSGGRFLNVVGQAVLDTHTLSVARYSLISSQVLERLQGFYIADKPALAFSPGGTRFVILGSRRNHEVDKPGQDFEYALVAFDYQRQVGTLLPIQPHRWHLPDITDVDATFVKRVLAWQTLTDGSELASLREDLALPPWQGKLLGSKSSSLSYQLKPVRPEMGDVLRSFLETEYAARLESTSAIGTVNLRVGDLVLSLGAYEPDDESVSLLYLDDWQRQQAAFAKIQAIAEHFNTRLADGEYQAYFRQ